MQKTTIIFIFLVHFFLIGSALGQPLFKYGKSIPVGLGPVAVEAGDLNNDGYIDLAVANSRSRNIIILMNDGKGGFGVPSNISIPITSNFLDIGDINGDGINDLVIASTDFFQIIYLENKGGGSFKIPEIFYDRCPSSISILDIEGNGFNDLIFSSSCDGKMVVRNNVNGTLDSNTTKYSAGGSPIDVAIADITNDNFSDVILVNNSYGSIAVYANQADGTFSMLHLYYIGNPCTSVSLSDFDGDNLIDMVVGFQNWPHIEILTNEGNGNFPGHLPYTDITGVPSDIISKDFDGVNGPDLAILHDKGSYSTLTIMLNNGDGTFHYSLYESNYHILAKSTGMTSTDFDCDGDLDIIVTKTSENKIFFFINNIATEIVSVFPARMYVIMKNEIEKHYGALTIKNFHNEFTAADIDTNSIRINGDIVSSTFSLHYPELNPCDQYIRAEFSIKEFLLGYGQMWDTTYANFEVTGRYLDSTEFAVEGEVTIIGHRSGDLNRDGQSNVQDLAVLIDFIFRGGSLPDIEGVADVNGTCGTVNITDVTYFVNYLFRSGPAPFHDCSE